MPLHTVSASREIPAPAADVYALIADYHEGHPAILPRPHLGPLTVEEGGTGAGTVIRVEARMMGLKGSFRARVTEPEPGRLLEETDLKNGRVTSFLVEPLPGGAGRCRVTITTRSRVRPGFLGRAEGRLIERMLHPIFEKELALLETVVTERAAPAR